MVKTMKAHQTLPWLVLALAVINICLAESNITKRAFCAHDETRFFPNIDYIEKGYNILRGYPLSEHGDPGFGHQIFDTEYYNEETTADCRYYVPFGWMINRVSSCTTTFEATTMKDATSLSNSLGVSVSANGGYMGLSFSASTEFTKQEDSMRRSSSKIIKSSATCQDFTVEMKFAHYPKFSESFKQLLRKLKQSINDTPSLKRNLHLLVDEFGTHYVKKLHFGAIYGFMYTLSSTEYEELSQESLSVEVQASYSGVVDAGISVGVNKGKSEASSKFREKASKKEFALGAKPPSDGQISTWTSSVLNNPYPIKYELSSIDELFDVHFTEMGDFLSAIEVRKIRTLLQDDILPGYCSWLNKNDDKIKASCPDSSNNELNLFVFRGASSLTNGFNSEYNELLANSVQMIDNLDGRACYERCKNAMYCTQYNDFYVRKGGRNGGRQVCILLIKDLDQGHIENAIKSYYTLYDYSYLEPYWRNIDSAVVGVIVPKLEKPAILKGITFRDNHSLHKKKCHVSADGLTSAYLCMQVCTWDVDCVAYESTERGGFISNCFIYYELSEKNWAETEVGLFDTVLMSYKAKIKSKAMAENSHHLGYQLIRNLLRCR